MPKIQRGRFTISVNILMTTSLITRALTFGFVIMSIYIKASDDILDSTVIRVVNNYNINGIPYGTAVFCLVFSLIGVFVLDLITGIFGLYGAFRKNKYMLTVNVVMSSMLIIVYIIYIVLFAIIYGERFDLAERLYTYSRAFMYFYDSGQYYAYLRLSWEYQYNIFPAFINQLGCSAVRAYQYSACYDVYMEKLESYLHTYFGLLVTCIMCQALSIVVIEYIYRKMEVKKISERISNTKYFLLCTMHFGMFRNFTVFIKESFKRSKLMFVTVAIKLSSVVMGTGLLALGLIIVGNDFITDYKLKDLFYKLQFYNLYLYDIITGVTASCIVFGVATIVIAVTGLVGSWRKSNKLLVTSTVVSVMLLIPRLAAVLIWIILQVKINEDLQIQMNIEQTGYNKHWPITTEWNTMIQTLDCCGVNSTYDTFDSAYPIRSIIFCYENAREIVAYPSETYDNLNNLNFYYGTGNNRTTTCKNKIQFRIEMMIGWFSAVTILQILLEMVGTVLVNKEIQIYHPASFVPKQNEKTETVESNEKKPQHILLILLVVVKQFVVNTWKRSKMTSLLLSSVTVIILMNFGLLVVALKLRYDDVFGNRYINGYIFDDIVIAGRSFSSSIENFYIVVTTFSVVSLCFGIYAYIVSAVQFIKRCLLLYLVMLFSGILFISNVIQVVLWGVIHSHVSEYITSKMKSDLIKYYYLDKNVYWHTKSVGWNTLFIKAQCCGVESYLQSFNESQWWSTSDRSAAQIPIYCCKSETILYPYTSRTNTDCTRTMTNGTFHDLVCDEAIKTRLYEFSISFFVITAFVMLSQIICIVTTLFNIYNEKKEQSNKRISGMTNDKKDRTEELSDKTSDITVGDDPKLLVPVNNVEDNRKITDITVDDDSINSVLGQNDEYRKKRSRKKKRKLTTKSLPPIKETFKQTISKKKTVDDINENYSDIVAQKETTHEEGRDPNVKVNLLDGYPLNETFSGERKNENDINYISYNKLEIENENEKQVNEDDITYKKQVDNPETELKER